MPCVGCKVTVAKAHSKTTDKPPSVASWAIRAKPEALPEGSAFRMCNGVKNDIYISPVYVVYGE